VARLERGGRRAPARAHALRPRAGAEAIAKVLAAFLKRPRPRMSESRDFTLAKYDELCRALVDSEYRCLAIAVTSMGRWRPASFVRAPAARRGDLSRSGRAHGRGRSAHGPDRDLFPARARPRLSRGRIARLRALGHDIGYHYDTLAAPAGTSPAPSSCSRKDLRGLRATGPVRLASMHG
jgi:hypothetical protein